MNKISEETNKEVTKNVLAGIKEVRMVLGSIEANVRNKDYTKRRNSQLLGMQLLALMAKFFGDAKKRMDGMEK